MSNLSLLPNEESEVEVSALMVEIIPRTMREIRRHSSFKDASLSLVQFRVLARLWHGVYTNKELADEVDLSVAAMSRLITGLTRRDLLMRTENPENRREMRINLTDKGRCVFQEIRGTTSRRLGERLKLLSPGERNDLRRALVLLSNTLLTSTK